MDISQDDVKLLIDQVRELTTRVHRLEQRLQGTAETSLPVEAAPTPPAPTVQPAMPVRSTPAPPPPAPLFATTAPPDKESNLESRIGAHWFNRIGIAAVLIGVSYFLKLAIQNLWIGYSAQIALGLVAGIAVVLWSERFRNKGYRIFSYSLKAVGIGVLYLSLWASFQVYHLMPSGVVFACMAIVTGATCALALSQDAEILAVFAITGGFSTPVLLSTGVNREVALFSYVLLLDLGILALVAFKPWRRMLWLGFAGTLALYLAWYADYYTRSQIDTTLSFATLFFAVFAAAPMFMLRQEEGAGVMPLMFAFVNAATYFLQAYKMISEISNTYMAWFSLALAAVYLGLNRGRSQTSMAAENNLRLMHLALAVGLITVAIPIRLEAHWITMGWFVEAAALLWIGERIKSDLLSVFALAALVLGIGRLLFFYTDFAPGQLILNFRMAVYAVAVSVLGFTAYIAAKRGDENARIIGAVAIVAMNLLALWALSLEVSDYYSRQLATASPAQGFWRPENWMRVRSVEIVRDFTYSALYMGYGAMLMVIGFWRASAFVRWQGLILIAVTIGKVFVYDLAQLDRVYRILSFIVLGILLLAISFAYQKDWLKLSSRKASAAGASSRT